ncbi:PTS lactose/cellobiose transporter subunit IIA [Shouchella clausii]|jgi:cellobiose PTS system EIIA component|uniref:PTS lactose/cellobiose transporter subunit IIA n=1 Tax=Shouchella clausii TaxID=79880 RepID=A0A268S044_SHOCL|nr:PTS lactose/cellobiose transporter subunit IIA [Shouchella clausii]PAD41829.1 PTS lactose/cellobiose transporter subunit IIA [Bacillus sp. 7520-S]AST97783.1 PTS lactose/cellobiose transporter subunit IIA [Shouchella clausii]MBU8598225.1 PTS lactose/cellobiose transporter subunit IIA [Shouchella clausii]MCR1289811.1 PTS lactose/cellobiose transporter subunit IIA [Shouchella clausii]MCY1104585.1 PTS lactose/cellobiose transporter subunit IIA [Shouchella clausii]
MVDREQELEALNLISMQMILHAGDARNDVMEALKCCEEEEYDRAEKLLEKANKDIVASHKLQTETVQKEARGEESIFSLLFAHAQDTLMTVKSEYELAKRLIRVFRRLDEKIDGKRGQS